MGFIKTFKEMGSFNKIVLIFGVGVIVFGLIIVGCFIINIFFGGV